MGAAARPTPEAVTCTSGGFPRNLARLNNVDKACLDDVASKLRQDPRSRVVIVGHADRSERYPDVIARQRRMRVSVFSWCAGRRMFFKTCGEACWNGISR